MSYRLIQPPFPSRAGARGEPQYYPLSLGQETAPVPARTGIDIRKVLAVIAMIAIAYAIYKALSKKKPSLAANARASVKRASTAQLAQALFDKLDRRGDANPTVMRSLASYARRS